MKKKAKRTWKMWALVFPVSSIVYVFSTRFEAKVRREIFKGQDGYFGIKIKKVIVSEV